jgi:diguanylate cyclase (GGDEF)-like protein/PAS domain S-box-containing protein
VTDDDDELGPAADDGRAGVPHRYELAFEDSAIGMTIEGLDGRFVTVNPAFCHLTGYSRAELLTMTYMDICHPSDLEGEEHLSSLADGTLRTYTQELRYIRSDRAEVWVRVHIGVIKDDTGRPAFYSVQVEDISERHRAEQRFRAAFDDAAVGMALIELDGDKDIIVEANAMTGRLLGGGIAALIGTSISSLVHPDDAPRVRAMFSDLHSGACRQTVVSVRIGADGDDVVWAHLSASAPDSRGDPSSFAVLHLQDITSRKVAEEQLTYQADHDALTGLPNRHAFTRQLEAMATAANPADRRALLFIDLDRFKLVNDSLGHTIGDELLVAVAGRLRGAVAAEDLVARIGGDEFVVLARSTPTVETAKLLAERVRSVMETPFGIAGRMLYVTASVGIALPEPGARSEELLPAADLAMHGAKANGRAGAMVFDPAMRRKAAARLTTEQGLHQALERGELVLWYQSIFSLVTGQPVAAEALVRWQHPQAGLLEPAAFLPVAAASGLIVPIGRYVIEQALDQVRSWRRHGLTLAVNVNLAAAQLDDPGLVAEIGGMLSERGLRPSDLCLEVSEKAVLASGNRAARTVTALRRLGVSVAIDDFGAGTSSLAYLRRTPVDVVKIDGAFVATIDTNPRDAAIVGAVIQLTHALGMACVAESVETRAQLRHLSALGCDQIQGFLTARAQPVDRWLATVSQPHLSGAETPLARLIGADD